MKVTKSSAQQLIELYSNLYAQNREEWYHVRDIKTKQIVLEVNIIRRHAKIYIDYQRDAYVDVDLPWDDAFIIRDNLLLVSMEGVKTHAIFAMEVVE